MQFTKWTAVRVLALMLTVALVWCLNHDRMALRNWSVPVDYHEDTLMVMSWIQSAADGDFVPFLSKDIHRLGAPYEGNWNDWPVWGEEIIFGLGLVAKVVGLLTAANLGVLFGYLSTAVAFYACCRLLRFRREWAFVGAGLFAFTYFHAYRGLHHLMHTYSHTVPFAILSVWLIGFSRRMRLWDWRAWLCLATAFVMGLTNPYNLNLFGQLLCLALAAQWFTQRRKANLVVGAMALGLIVVCFLAINLDTFGYGWAHGKNADALQRYYYESELFALKPMELVIPPTSHKIAALAELGKHYLLQAWVKGEMFSPYLGVVGVAGLLWMFGEAIWRQLKRRHCPQRVSAHAVQVLWVMGFAVIGGLNCLIAAYALPLFRGSNRYSIFISALVLLFLVSRLSRLSRGWQPSTRLAVAAGVLVVGLFDQLPQAISSEETAAWSKMVENDRAFTEAMEAKLPRGAMVFQLPVMPYPESTPVQGVQAYEHFRPYFFSKQLRFSFGSNKGRPREDWQQDVEKLSPAEMVKTLERYGFAALYLNRKGFADQGQALLRQLAETGKGQILEDAAREQVCVLLNPSANPELPPPGSRIPLTFPSGWVAINQGQGGQQCWAGGNASVVFYGSDKELTSRTLTCQVASMMPRRVGLKVNGVEVWNATLAGNQVAPVTLTFDARPGKNKLEFTTDSYTRPSKYEPLPRAFVVVAPKITRGNAARNP